MYSNKNEGPRRGRSFDSMNIGFEEKLLNNEVRTACLCLKYFIQSLVLSGVAHAQYRLLSRESRVLKPRGINLSRFVVLKFTSKN